MEEELENIFKSVQEGSMYPYEGVDKVLKLLRDSVKEETVDDEFSESASKVEQEFGMGGLTGGIYEDFARGVFRDYLERITGYE